MRKTKKKIKKKTTKVKKKTVKSRKKTVKKKTVKKKTNKKRQVSKKKKKKKKKKRAVKNAKKTRRRKKKISMEDIYSILNKVQISKKKVTFATYLVDAPTIENNIRDVDLRYKKVGMKTQAVFTIYPNDVEYSEDDRLIRLEIMDDEIPDIDQIFG